MWSRCSSRFRFGAKTKRITLVLGCASRHSILLASFPLASTQSEDKRALLNSLLCSL